MKDLQDRIAKQRARDRINSLPGIGTYQVGMVCRDGTILPIEVVTNPIIDEKGNFTGWHGVSRDISERKHVEEALMAANEKLNLLSSITRHDINNQIMGLRAYLELSKKNPDRDRLLHTLRRRTRLLPPSRNRSNLPNFTRISA